jgi:hypothetical protein
VYTENQASSQPSSTVHIASRRQPPTVQLAGRLRTNSLARDPTWEASLLARIETNQSPSCSRRRSTERRTSKIRIDPCFTELSRSSNPESAEPDPPHRGIEREHTRMHGQPHRPQALLNLPAELRALCVPTPKSRNPKKSEFDPCFTEPSRSSDTESTEPDHPRRETEREHPRMHG